MSLKGLVNDWKKKPVFILSIGIRKSGKSYNSLALIELAMAKNVFDYYILCLPVYDYEQTDSYKFIKDYEKANKGGVAIYDKYSYLITDKILAAANKISKKRILIFVDDAMLSKSAIYEQNFYGLLSIARHLGISIMLNFHSLTSGRVLSPFVRQNIDLFCLYKVVSDQLLKLIYDEYVSLVNDIVDWKTFRTQYIKHVNSGEFQSLLLDARTGEIDWNLKDLKKYIDSHSSVSRAGSV